MFSVCSEHIQLAVEIKLRCKNSYYGGGGRMFMYKWTCSWKLKHHYSLEKLRAKTFNVHYTMASAFKKCINFDNLPIGDYMVHSFTLVTTKFGEKVRCDIGDKVVFLPKRCIDELDGSINIQLKLINLNHGKYWLLYRGKDVSRGNRLMVEIVSQEAYVNQFLNIGFLDNLSDSE